MVSVPVSVSVSSVTLGVLDVGHVALVAVDVVVDGLDAAVGEVDVVLAAGVLAVPLLAVAELGRAVVLGVTVHLVAVFVVGMVVAVAMAAVTAVAVAVVGGGGGRGEDGEEDDGGEGQEGLEKGGLVVESCQGWERYGKGGWINQGQNLWGFVDGWI